MNALHRTLAVAFAVLAVVGVFAPMSVDSVAASTPPDALCPVCEAQLESAAREAGTSATATASRMRMTVGEDGDGRVAVRVTLNASTAERFRENPGTVDAVVDAAFEDSQYAFGVERERALTATMDGDDLLVTYVVPDVAREASGGVLLVTAFGERENYVDTNVDAFVLAGPDGWRVANAPASGEVTPVAAAEGRDGESVRWRDTADYDSPLRLERGTYVAFAPNDGAAARAAAELAVATTIGPTMLAHALRAAGPSAVVLGLGLAACLFVLGGSSRPGRDSQLLAVLGGLVTVGGFAFAIATGYGPLYDRNLELLALPAGVTTFALLSARAPAVANLRDAALRATATIGIGGLVSVVLSDTFLDAALVTATVTVAGFYLVGVYDGRVGWPVAAVTATVLATPALAVLPATPIWGFGPGFAAVLLTPVTVVAVLVGLVTYRIGAGKDVVGERVVDSRTTA